MGPVFRDDRELVRRLLAGEEAAFDSFFEGHFPRLYRFALSRTGDPDAAEELVQAALARAVSKLHTWRGEAALLTWLTTFCRHEIGDWLERRQRSPQLRSEDDPAVRAALDSLARAQAGPHDAAVRAELARRVHLALDALPSHYADVLEWKYLLGLSVQEIAARLGSGAKATESLLTRAREAFRDAFASLAEERT